MQGWACPASSTGATTLGSISNAPYRHEAPSLESRAPHWTAWLGGLPAFVSFYRLCGHRHNHRRAARWTLELFACTDFASWTPERKLGCSWDSRLGRFLDVGLAADVERNTKGKVVGSYPCYDGNGSYGPTRNIVAYGAATSFTFVCSLWYGIGGRDNSFVHTTASFVRHGVN